MRRIIGLTRYVVLVPALASIVGAILLMGQGSFAMIVAVIDTLTNISSLKELFIDTEIEVPDWLQVKDLDDLKSKLIGVVVAIIAVVFVGVFVDAKRAADVLPFGLGAGALVAGLAIFAYATKKPGSAPKYKAPKL
jgi:uncharacterized membrane protein YqhA